MAKHEELSAAALRRLKAEQARYYDHATLHCLEPAESPLDDVLRDAMFATLYRFLDLLAPGTFAGKTVLDVFCNHGMHFPHYLARGATRVVGCDISAQALQKGRARHRGPVHYVRGDCEHLPFGPQRFDVVCCFGGFHHSPQKAALLRQLHATLRPGGQLLLSDPNGRHLLRSLTDLVGTWTDLASAFEEPWDPETTGRLLTAEGFAVRDCQPYNVTSEALFHVADILSKRHAALGLPPKVALLAARRLDRLLERWVLPALPRLAWSYFIVAERLA